eukprot:4322355-Pyramimonas_sp.AAC.1
MGDPGFIIERSLGLEGHVLQLRSDAEGRNRNGALGRSSMQVVRWGSRFTVGRNWAVAVGVVGIVMASCSFA